jgi:hypothetical protein
MDWLSHTPQFIKDCAPTSTYLLSLSFIPLIVFALKVSSRTPVMELTRTTLHKPVVNDEGVTTDGVDLMDTGTGS